MFGKLKDKLKNWTKKISDEQKEKEEIKESETLEKTEEPQFSEKEIEPSKIKDPSGFKIETSKSEPELENVDDLKKVVESKSSRLKRELTLQDQKPFKVKKSKKKDKIDILKKEIEESSEKLLENSKNDEPGTKSFFRKVTGKISKIKISEKEFDVYADELEMLLLENNVAIEVTEKIIEGLKEQIIGKELLKKEVAEEIKDTFKEIIEEILIEPFSVVDKIKEKQEKPYVVLFCGVNGTGKTTSIAKVVDYLKRNEISCIIAAADTFRAASIEQIKKHGEKLGTKVISHDYGSDPASVGYDAISYARKNKIDCVLIDTAGRMHTAKNLLKEMEKIVKVCQPDLKVFVGESITGNDILEQVRSFDWAIGIDGVILTKADIDEKGGTALSVGYVTKKPILYLGTGQEYEKMEPFDRKKFIERLGL